MLRRLLHAWQGRRERSQLTRHAVPDALWELTLARYPFIARRSAADRATLRRLCSLFLARKEFHGAGGFQVTDEVAVAVAAQACLPVLTLGLEAYDGFVGIVMHESQVVAPREFMDEDGVVHEYEEELAGEAMEGGPLMLAWSELQADPALGAGPVYNVVIHEFAHVLDMSNGASDGIPALPSAQAVQAWIDIIDPAWAQFCECVDAGEDTLIDPYGAESVEEFFAVATEAFFVEPAQMLRLHPALYKLFAEFYQQDPAAGDTQHPDTDRAQA
ncbi:zinc-dependent peptidase [Roseateles sp. DB2]|uniref:M90 family metallopeptidase n=1 Tax=Roseateles sp. DB2 TaxID=3453717 RepID=UPI003EF08B61